MKNLQYNVSEKVYKKREPLEARSTLNMQVIQVLKFYKFLVVSFI